MNRPGEPGSGSSTAVLEERMRRLEGQVGALAEAIDVLARGLEGDPTAEPQERGAEEAARRAHELLLLVRSAQAESPR